MPSQLSPCVHNCNTHPPSPCLPPHTHTHTHIHTHTHSHTHTHTHTHTLSPIPTTQAVYRHLLPASPPQSVCFTSCPFRASSCRSSAPIRPAVALLRTCTSAAPSLHTCMRLCRARPTSPLPTALMCRHTAAALQTSSQPWRYPRECVCEYVCVCVCVCQSVCVCVKVFVSNLSAPVRSQHVMHTHPHAHLHTRTHTLSLSPPLALLVAASTRRAGKLGQLCRQPVCGPLQ